MIGETLGHYRIVRQLGSGGMGEVYAAEDQKLHRLVALKVLSAPFRSDDERRERFQREAQAVAALNHPNIVTIYSVELSGSTHFLTMEMVEGRPLSELIPAGGLPLDRLLKLAIALADAVSAAHQRGITHRDLKPANVIVGDDGRLKVLDFGLAKLKEAQDSFSAATTLATPSLTGEGRIIGTAAYMSPEQAEGRTIDHRSDIFSLGIVLYEMVTGQRPFKGDTSVSVLSSILKDTPRSVNEVNRALPRDLGRIVRRCLMKDPEERYESAKDIRNDLQELKQSLESGELSAPIPAVRVAKSGIRKWPIMTAAAVVLTAFAINRYGPGFNRPAQSGRSATFAQLTVQSGAEQFPSLSPDGRWMVYTSAASGNLDIYLQSVGGQTAINLTKDTTADDQQPAFSPDGEQIAFQSSRDGGGIFVMGRTGESVRRLTDGGYNPAWSPNGKEVAFGTENVQINPAARGPRSGLWIVNVGNGEKRQIATEDSVQPSWSPDGSRIAFWAARGSQRQRDILTISVGGGEAVPVTDDVAVDWNPVWAPDGKSLYYLSNRAGSMNLWRIGIEQQSGRALGLPEAITVPAGFVAHISVSADERRIAYSSIEVEQNVQRVAMDPESEKILGEPQAVTSGSKVWSNVDVSRDGQWIVLSSSVSQEDLFVARADGAGLRQLTNDPANDRFPRWSPDGKRIAFYSNRAGSWEVWTINADGSGLSQLTRDTGAHYPIWSPEGSRMLFSEIVERRGVSIFELGQPRQGQTPKQLPSPATGAWRATSWSSDGRLLAGVETSGDQAIRLVVYSLDSRSFKTLSELRQDPYWLPDNRRMIFTKALGVLSVADWQTGAIRNVLSRPTETFFLGSVSSDGRMLYLLRRSHEADIWMTTLN
jgi:Tol biopolymer transport system component/predicted Ser/Thr protein kinase